jgi:hypothetical protein
MKIRLNKQTASKTNATRARDQQERLISELLTGKTLGEACEAIGISRNTGWRLRRDPEFQQTYREARESILDAALDQLSDSAVVFCRTLREVCEDPNTNGNAKATAARNGLEALFKLSEQRDVVRRLEALEQAAAENRE